MKTASQTTRPVYAIGCRAQATGRRGHWSREVVDRRLLAAMYSRSSPAAFALACAVSCTALLVGAEIGLRLARSDLEGSTSTSALGDIWGFAIGALLGSLVGGLLAAFSAGAAGAAGGREYGIAASAVATLVLLALTYARSRSDDERWWSGADVLAADVLILGLIGLPVFLAGALGATLGDD
jgi:hypothetical protein